MAVQSKAGKTGKETRAFQSVYINFKGSQTSYCSAYLTRRDFKCEICFPLSYSRDFFIILIYIFGHKQAVYWKLKAHDFVETPERMVFMYSKSRTQKKEFLLNSRDCCVLH